MKSTRCKLIAGFSLIEVMIALVILAVGVLGISKLQSTLIKNSSNANQRAVAVSIAQKKIDDLKSFTNLTTASASVPDAWMEGASNVSSTLAANELAYTHIEDNKGGAPIGSTGLLDGSQTVGNYTYTLSWDVTDYWQGTSTASVPTTTAPTAGAVADEKLVTVTVAWTDELGDSQNVALSTIINAYSPSLTALSGKIAPGGDGPDVAYTPLEAPDVVPVSLDIGDLKKESSKPLPDVSKRGDSTVVKFETVTYSPNGLKFNTERQEEFQTAVCKCSTGPTPDTVEIDFGSQVWEAETQSLQDVVIKKAVSTIEKTDVDNSGPEVQDISCTACCRDSADVSGTDFKTCRMKRIDGIYRLVEPWRMIAFNLIPASYFSEPGLSSATASNSIPTMTSTLQSENIARYSDYVIEKVRNALVTLQGASTITPDTDFDSYSGVNSYVNSITIDHTKFTTGGQNRELQVRAVYLDIPDDGIYEGGVYAPIAAVGVSAVPLDRIPFYENNFTQIAGWIPDISVGADGSDAGDQGFSGDYTLNHDDMDSDCLQTDTPSAGRNYVTNESFVSASTNQEACTNASRGNFYPIVTASSGVVPTTDWRISSRIYTSNDGVIDRLVNTSVSTVDDTIDLTISP